MMRLDYQIGGHWLAVEGMQLGSILTAMPSFETFRQDLPDNVEPVCNVKESMDAPLDFERVIYELKDLDTTFRFGCIAGGYRLQQLLDDGRTLDLWTNADQEHGMLLAGDMEIRMLRYALWMAYGIHTVGKQTVMIHSSCIVCHGQAVLFLGESGTGKSTHTRLWRKYIAGSHLLNDDSPVLRIEHDKVWVCGSPWSGKTPCYRQERFPLKGCVRLLQAPRNEMKRLAVLQGYAALHPSAPPAFAYDRSLFDSVSSTLGRVLECIPCFLLACLPDEEAAQLAHRMVFE